MIIKVGKRYLRADGSITGVILPNKNGVNAKSHKFIDYNREYRENGLYNFTSESEFDLIAEVPEFLIEKLIKDVLEYNGVKQ